MIAIYARVSTEDQATGGYSIQDQLRACQQKIENKATREFVDQGISGEFLERPALTQLRQEICCGLIKKVVCLDPDRLSRKLMHQLLLTEELEQAGVELIFVNGDYQKTPEGALFYSLRGAVAEFEKAKITERMSRGRREKARQGKVLRDFQIYGYDYDKGGNHLVINPLEAAIVEKIFSLFLSASYGISDIARYLTEQEIPTKRGAEKWHRQVVRQILMNSTYIGRFFQNRWDTRGMLANKLGAKRVSMRERPREEWIEIPCPAIISKQSFQRAQSILAQSRRRFAGKSENVYLLKGILRCGNCHQPLQGHSGKGGKEYYTDTRNNGCGIKLDARFLEETIWEQLVSFLLNPQQFVLYNSIDEGSNPHRKLAEIKRQRQRILDVLQKGLASACEVSKRLEDLKNQEKLFSEGQNRPPHCLDYQVMENLLGQKLADETRMVLIRLLFKEIIVGEKEIILQTF